MNDCAKTDAGLPEHADDRRPRSVVVGVDGSTASRQALLFAADEAQMRQAGLQIVAAHDPGTGVVVPSAEPPMLSAPTHLAPTAMALVLQAGDRPAPSPAHRSSHARDGRHDSGERPSRPTTHPASVRGHHSRLAKPAATGRATRRRPATRGEP